MIPVAAEELHTDAACKCIAPSAHKWCTIVCTGSVVAPRGGCTHTGDAQCTQGAAQGGAQEGAQRGCTVHRGETMTERVRGSSAALLFYYSAS